MASKKKKPPVIQDDTEFLDTIEKLDSLDLSDKDVSAVKGDDFDFDGHDVELDAIPSWIEEEAVKKPKNGSAPTFDDESDDLAEGFTLDEGETFLVEPQAPDTSELFAVSGETTLGELSALEDQRDTYLEALRQLQADFENYKKRVIRDQQEYAEIKSVKLMEELLPVIDNFQLALGMLEGKSAEDKKLRKGIELVYNELVGVMERQGLEKIDAEGAIFDPEFHDAVSHEDNDEHDQEIVTEVLREGYKVRGRVVRPAMVKVAR